MLAVCKNKANPTSTFYTSNGNATVKLCTNNRIMRTVLQHSKANFVIQKIMSILFFGEFVKKETLCSPYFIHKSVILSGEKHLITDNIDT